MLSTGIKQDCVLGFLEAADPTELGGAGIALKVEVLCFQEPCYFFSFVAFLLRNLARAASTVS